MPTISATVNGEVLLVEVQRVGVHGQQGEPDVVRLRDGAAGPVLVDVADREVLVSAPEALAIAPLPDLFYRLNHAPSSAGPSARPAIIGPKAAIMEG
jgi:hypothetical protein